MTVDVFGVPRFIGVSTGCGIAAHDPGAEERQSMARQWKDLPITDISEADLLQAAREGRVLVAALEEPNAPYPIIRVRLVEGTGGDAALEIERLRTEIARLHAGLERMGWMEFPSENQERP